MAPGCRLVGENKQRSCPAPGAKGFKPFCSFIFFRIFAALPGHGDLRVCLLGGACLLSCDCHEIWPSPPGKAQPAGKKRGLPGSPPWNAAGKSAPHELVEKEAGISYHGRPSCSAFPNVYFFPTSSSYFESGRGEWVDSPTDGPSNGASGSRAASQGEHWHKKRAHADNEPSRSYSPLNDTSVLSTDATTSHCKRKCLPERPGDHRHKSRGSPPPAAARKTRKAGEGEYSHGKRLMYPSSHPSFPEL